MCFFKVKNYFGHISGMVVRLMWNEKEVHRLDTGYNMWPWSFCLTHDLDHGYFKVKFRNSCISGIVGLIDVKWKGSESIEYWADYMTLPFDHIHDQWPRHIPTDSQRDLWPHSWPWPWMFQGKISKWLSQELLVWLIWNENEVSEYDTGPIVWPCPLTTPMTLTLELKFQGQSLK